MKRLFTPIVCAALALTLAAGCGQTAAPSSSAEEPQAQPLHLETLAVELPRDYAPDDETLLQAIANAPELLKAALAEQQVEVDAVTVTVGASAGATCQALTGGTVDLAFLSAESYLEAGGGGTVLLADAGEGDQAGTASVLWSAPSDYGQALARRLADGKDLTWTELRHARWGVLDRDSDLGWRSPNLWLSDQYEGMTLDDLSQVTTYASYEELLRAAAAEEIDLFPMPRAALEEWAEAWTLESSRTDGAGRSGLGRPVPMTEEVFAIAAFEPLLSSLAVVREEDTLSSDTFAQALAAALEELGQTQEGQALLSVLGANRYVPAGAEQLDPLRRILTMEGVAL